MKAMVKNANELVLAELQKNCRKNFGTIANNCSISKQRASRIIKQLEKENTIWGYPAVIDEQKRGLQKFFLLMKRSPKKIDDETAEQLISYRTDKDIADLGVTVENSYYTNGEYDWILIFTAKDLLQARKFSDVLLNKHRGMVSKVNLIQIMMTLRTQSILNPGYMKLREFL